MDAVDEQGRLFGLVNVIDALLVLLLASVLLAGVALLLQDPQPETNRPSDTETRYATISFGPIPADVAETIEPGEDLRIAGGGRATITDRYVLRRPNGTSFVVVRAALPGRVRNGSFAPHGGPIPVTGTASPVGASHEVSATILALDRSGERLQTARTPLVLEATVPTAVANRLRANTTDPGDTVRGGTVESVTVFPAADPRERRIRLGVRLRTLVTGAGPEFAGRPVRVGRTLSLETEIATVNATVLARGTLVPPGERETVTVRLAWHDVDPAVAEDVTVGSTERIGGSVSARVLDRRVTSETIVVRTDNGTLVAREHPRRRTVYLTVALRARRTDDGLVFHGRRLLVGRPVVLDFGTVSLVASLLARN